MADRVIRIEDGKITSPAAEEDREITGPAAEKGGERHA